jgi:hypothetical protein
VYLDHNQDIIVQQTLRLGNRKARMACLWSLFNPELSCRLESMSVSVYMSRTTGTNSATRRELPGWKIYYHGLPLRTHPRCKWVAALANPKNKEVEPSQPSVLDSYWFHFPLFRYLRPQEAMDHADNEHNPVNTVMPAVTETRKMRMFWFSGSETTGIAC